MPDERRPTGVRADRGRAHRELGRRSLCSGRCGVYGRYRTRSDISGRTKEHFMSDDQPTDVVAAL